MVADRHPPGAAMHGRGPLDPKLCQVIGLNQNYQSPSGTLYHIQVEDRGPLRDKLTGRPVRRVSVIVYANYGEPSARIVHGRDHDFDDLRTAEHNRLIAAKIQELAEQARTLIREKETGQVARIKALLRRYYLTKDGAAKREFEHANMLYPFLFSRAWAELKRERQESGEPAAVEASTPFEYPLDPSLREQVMEIERILGELTADLWRLEAQGVEGALVQSCQKIMDRAAEVLGSRVTGESATRRLEGTRSALATAWRQVRSMLR